MSPVALAPAPQRLMAVLAHPDDESMGFGPTLARYAAEGVEITLVMATRGQKGWKLRPRPGPETIGFRRSRELDRAAKVLGLARVIHLDLIDGEVDRADPVATARRIAELIRRWRPQVLLAFGPEGAYGHPDHIATSQLATAACLVAAADGDADRPPHRVAKLYQLAETERLTRAWLDIFGDLKSPVDGVERRFGGWPEWLPSARIDTRAHAPTAWKAIFAHRSQLRELDALLDQPDTIKLELFAEQTFVRVFSLVNGGREIETDLFAGLRSGVPGRA